MIIITDNDFKVCKMSGKVKKKWFPSKDPGDRRLSRQWRRMAVARQSMSGQANLDVCSSAWPLLIWFAL